MPNNYRNIKFRKRAGYVHCVLRLGVIVKQSKSAKSRETTQKLALKLEYYRLDNFSALCKSKMRHRGDSNLCGQSPMDL